MFWFEGGTPNLDPERERAIPVRRFCDFLKSNVFTFVDRREQRATELANQQHALSNDKRFFGFAKHGLLCYE